ncbi:hypothetical protein CPEBRM1_ABPJDJAI_02463 [Companilactobacillus paralimentarius]|uniref:helix-turn-helix domain-containing protein n=1 Tax=Companilactobacillus paralimentarius TaxID=83526 RepID=UPI00384B0ABC
MLIDYGEILKTSGFSNQELSNRLGISIAKVELIENKQFYPNESLAQKIIRFSKQKTSLTPPITTNDIQFGQPIKLTRVIFSIILIVFISLLFTGFGYQPFWVFLLVLLIGLFVTLPSCFNDYWLINKNSLKINEFSSSGATKLAQLLHIIPITQRTISYQDINHINIIYRTRPRTSPFDINPDIFQLVCTLKNNQELSIDLNVSFEENLLNLITIFTYQGVDVYDQQKILLALTKKENLFQKFNPKFS